jgi:quinol-cytochrome oxidoreductase complex cytochrome b subunit
MVTPPHIVPEWYFLPFYAMLRAITFDIGIPFTDITIISAKLGGVIAMFGSIALLFVLPWLDTHPIRSARFRPLYRIALRVFLLVFVLLGYIGSQPADATWGPVPLSIIGLLGTTYYYGFFLVILPYLSRKEKGTDLPQGITIPVLEGKEPQS